MGHEQRIYNCIQVSNEELTLLQIKTLSNVKFMVHVPRGKSTRLDSPLGKRERGKGKVHQKTEGI